MKNRLIIRNIVIDALFLALFFLFTFTPYLGYITIVPGMLSITTMHLLVLVGGSLFGYKKATLYGFFFGLTSLIKASTMPGMFDFFFVNPFVSILPRVLFGFLTGKLLDFIKRRVTVKTFTFVLPLVSVFLTFIHTFLTLSSLYIFGILDIFKISYLLDLTSYIEMITESGYFTFLGISTVFGMLGEMAASFILVPIIFVGLRYIPFIKENDNQYKVITRNTTINQSSRN